MRLLTIAEAAERLKIAPGGVRRLVHEGRLLPVRPFGARAVRFTEEALDHLIAELCQESAAARPPEGGR